MANKYTYSKICSAEELRVLYESGKSQAEIAEHFGTTQKVVWATMKRLGIKARIAVKRNQSGSRNSYWGGPGGRVGYAALHKRVEALKGRPRKCEDCGTESPQRTYDWANISGKYDDPSDYKRLCRSCHWKLDKKILNIVKMRKRGAQCQKS